MVAAFDSAQVDQPALQSGSYGLDTVGHSELAENVIDVTLNRCVTNPQAGAYFFIALALRDQFQHLHLSAGQIGAGHSLGKPIGDRGGNVP